MKFIGIIILLIGNGVLALAQEASRPVAVPSRRLVTRGELHHPLSEIHLDIEESAGKPGDMVAMRICTHEPLPIALFIGVVNPVGIGESFVQGAITGRLKFAPERVLILRSPDCPVTDAPYVPVEFWGVPRGAVLPSSVESIKLCQVKIEEVGSKEPIKSLRGYRAALKALAGKLSVNPELTGVILGKYNLRTSASLKRALRESGRVLEQAGVARRRFFVRLKPSAQYEPEYGWPEPKFPDIFAVQITQACND
jgi:hypothetical protein